LRCFIRTDAEGMKILRNTSPEAPERERERERERNQGTGLTSDALERDRKREREKERKREREKEREARTQRRRRRKTSPVSARNGPRKLSIPGPLTRTERKTGPRILFPNTVNLFLSVTVSGRARGRAPKPCVSSLYF